MTAKQKKRKRLNFRRFRFNSEPFAYETIVVEAGTQVVWNVQAAPEDLNGCNIRLFINEYGIEKSREVGENFIVFTPEKPGTYMYSCWMGMICGVFIVKDA